MAYKKIKSYEFSEAELRSLWHETYCREHIITFDGITVHFYPEMFDHAFYESDDRLEKDKSILSLNRCEKMLWIKDTLEDPTAILKQGWISRKKSHDPTRRVALIKGNYVVIINIMGNGKARFITAFQIDDEENLEKLKNGPDWAQKKR